MKIRTLTRFLKWSLKNKENVLIKGAPGIGKTDIVHKVCKKLGYNLIIFTPVIDSPIDYKGLGAIVNGRAVFLPYGNLEQLIDAKKPTVAFFDDLGQAPAAVQSAVMQLIWGGSEKRGSLNGKVISDHVRFVAATNRREDKANVNGILEPVKSRFTSIVELEVDANDWIKWAEKKKMPKQLIHYIQWRPEMLFKFKATKDIENTPSPRTVAAVGRIINKKLPKEMLFEAVKGAAGHSFATEFTGFLRVYKELPTIKEILNNPSGCKIPDQIEAKFAAMGMVLDAVDKNNIGKFITFLDRLGNEVTTATMKLCSMKKPDVCKTSVYVEWAVKHNHHFKMPA